MQAKKENQQAPVCPSCGQPVKPGLLQFKLNGTAKILVFVFLLGYITLSIFLLLLSVPPELRRGCGGFDRRWAIPFTTPNPERCRDTQFDIMMKPLYQAPTFQVFVGSGVAVAVLLFYWDGLQMMYQNWQTRRGPQNQRREKIYRYACRRCGKQWD